MKSNNNQEQSMSVLIPDAEDWQAVKVLRCLGRDTNIETHVLSKNKRPLSRFSKYCKSHHLNTSQNDKEWLDKIIEIINKHKVNIVLPVTLKGVELVSKNQKTISEYANMPLLAKPEQIELTNDKWAFHKFLVEHDLPSVPTVYVGNSKDEINIEDIDSVEFPALLKPACEAGGFGIVKVEKASDLEQSWRDNRIMKNHEYVLQSFIPGVDVCLQVSCKEGKITAYTIQKSLSVSDEYFGPQRYMEFVIDEKLVELGNRITSAINWNGIACIDFRVDSRNGHAGTLEINPRYGQAILGSLAAGVNFPLIAAYSAMDKEYPHHYIQTRYAHPVPSAKIFISQIIRKKTAFSKQRWSESGLQFTYNDPMPELVDVVQRTGCKIRNKITNKSSSNNHN